MISIIIPAYNEELRIEATVMDYHDFFFSKSDPFEIIVVSNNCSDKTPLIVAALSEKYPEIRLINIPEKIGKGGAVKEGILKARGDWVGFTDADNATKPKEFYKIFSAATKSQCIAIGSRAVKGAKVLRQPTYRKYLGRGFNAIVRFLFKLPFRDTQCGAKIFPKEAAAQVFKNVKSNGWEFDVELLYEAKKAGYKIVEVAVLWVDSGETKIKPMTIPHMFFGLIKMRLEKNKSGKKNDD